MKVPLESMSITNQPCQAKFVFFCEKNTSDVSSNIFVVVVCHLHKRFILNSKKNEKKPETYK